MQTGLRSEIAAETANSLAGQLKTSVSHGCTPQDATKHNTMIHEWFSLSLRGEGTCDFTDVCVMLRAMEAHKWHWTRTQLAIACVYPASRPRGAMQNNIEREHNLTRMFWPRLRWCHQSHRHQHARTVISAPGMRYHNSPLTPGHKKLLLTYLSLAFHCLSWTHHCLPELTLNLKNSYYT